MACSFCNRPGDLPDRIFYEPQANGWFAFLSAPPHTKGHAILAAPKRGDTCPLGFETETLAGLATALANVVEALRGAYPNASDVLLSSLRGDVKHFHIHLLPRWPDEEAEWRRVTGYQDSHIMEFLGALEKKHDFLVLERVAKGKPLDVQREEWTQEHAPEIQALRDRTRYPG